MKEKPKNIWASKFSQVFGFDLRSLAAFRVGLALVILADLFTRLGDLTAHYTDLGVLPRSALEGGILKPWYWSIHLISGQPVVQFLIFLTAILVTLCLLVGYRTRLATIACWALIVSMHNRNPALIFAADDVLRAILFWAMFLPLGSAYSLDSAFNNSPKPLPKRVVSGATIALLVQQCFIYIFSAAFKTQSPTWFPDYTAVYYALSFDQYVTHIGRFLLNFPPLLSISTAITLVLEWIGPLFLLIPNNLVRLFTVLTFIGLHAGFGLTLNIGIFPFLSIATWLVFLPSSFWDGLARKFATQERQGLRIYYDADCGFCKKVVYILRTLLILPGTPLLLAQDDQSIYEDMQRINSWVVVDAKGNRYYKFGAIAYVVSISPIFFPLAKILRWQPIMKVGNRFYETIANNRRKAGFFTKPFKFRPLTVRPSLLLNIVTSLLLILTFLWNLRSFTNHFAFLDNKSKTFTALRRVTNSRTLQRIDPLSRISRLDQSWSIFAPSPPKDDGWHVMPGKLKNGEEVDVFQNGDPINWKKPTLNKRNSLYKNMQWRTYFINLNRNIGKKLYPHYGKYVCQNWNQHHQGEEVLESFEVYFVAEETAEPGKKQNLERKKVGEYSCSQQDKEVRKEGQESE